MISQRHTPDSLTPRRTRYPLYRRLGRPQSRKCRPHRDSIPGLSSLQLDAITTKLSRHTVDKNIILKWILKQWNGDMDCIELAQYMDRKWALVNAVKTLRGYIKYRTFLD